jgi:hypothetical protein
VRTLITRHAQLEMDGLITALPAGNIVKQI